MLASVDSPSLFASVDISLCGADTLLYITCLTALHSHAATSAASRTDRGARKTGAISWGDLRGAGNAPHGRTCTRTVLIATRLADDIEQKSRTHAYARWPSLVQDDERSIHWASTRTRRCYASSDFAAASRHASRSDRASPILVLARSSAARSCFRSPMGSARHQSRLCARCRW